MSREFEKEQARIARQLQCEGLAWLAIGVAAVVILALSGCGGSAEPQCYSGEEVFNFQANHAPWDKMNESEHGYWNDLAARECSKVGK